MLTHVYRISYIVYRIEYPTPFYNLLVVTIAIAIAIATANSDAYPDARDGCMATDSTQHESRT